MHHLCKLGKDGTSNTCNLDTGPAKKPLTRSRRRRRGYSINSPKLRLGELKMQLSKGGTQMLLISERIILLKRHLKRVTGILNFEKSDWLRKLRLVVSETNSWLFARFLKISLWIFFMRYTCNHILIYKGVFWYG